MTTCIEAGVAEVKARGAAAGQMLGFAMTDPAERAAPAQTLDDTVNGYLAAFSGSAVVGSWGFRPRRRSTR